MRIEAPLLSSALFEFTNWVCDECLSFRTKHTLHALVSQMYSQHGEMASQKGAVLWNGHGLLADAA